MVYHGPNLLVVLYLPTTNHNSQLLYHVTKQYFILCRPKDVSKEDVACDVYKFVCSMFNGDPHYIIDTLLLSSWGQEAHLNGKGSIVHHGLRLIVNDSQRYSDDPLAFVKYLAACKILYDEPVGKKFVRKKLAEIGVGPKGIAAVLTSKCGLRINWNNSLPEDNVDEVPLCDLIKKFKYKRVFAVSLPEYLSV